MATKKFKVTYVVYTLFLLDDAALNVPPLSMSLPRPAQPHSTSSPGQGSRGVTDETLSLQFGF